MAITDAPRPLALPTGGNQPQPKPLGVFTRPRATTGWRSWVTTVDHKKIGIMYGAAALVFFVVGGCEALLIRLQLWPARRQAAVGRPLQPGLHDARHHHDLPGRDAHRRRLRQLPDARCRSGPATSPSPGINAFSFWCFLAGGLFLNSSWCLGGGADGGWFNYAPNTGVVFSPSHGIDFWNLGLLITGIASLTGAVNLIVTVLNMRCPGHDLDADARLHLDDAGHPVPAAVRHPGAHRRPVPADVRPPASTPTSSTCRSGGNPLLWEHLFWIFGHPEVYLMILPAFGLVSEMLPVFSRKPIFGYPFIVFSGIAIGFMGWGVWAHHMFVSGIGPISVDHLLADHHVHRRAHRREDPQLDRHHVGRQAAVHHRRCCSRSAWSPCSPSVACRA